MKDESKTKPQLLAELQKLRNKNKELAKSMEEQKHTEEALRLSGIRFHSLIKYTSDAVFCCEYNPPIPINLPIKKQIKLLYQGVLVECNDVCARSYGASRAQNVIGKKLTELLGVFPGNLNDFFNEFIHSGYKIVDAEGIEVLPDGTKRYFLKNGHSVMEKGKLIRVWGIFRDITSRKQAEQALRESEKKCRSIIENAVDAIYLIDPQTQRILDCNQKASKLDGYSIEELKGMTAKDLHPKKEKALLPQKFKEVSQKGSVSGILGLHHKRKNATLVPVEIDASIIKLEGKQFYLSIVRNISERQRVETELRNSEERMKLLFEHAPDAYYLNDLKGNFIDGNKEAEKTLGYNRTELIGKNFLKLKLLSPHQVAKAAALLAKNAMGKSTGPDEFTLSRKDGSQVTIEVRSHPIKIKDQTMVLGIAHDITKRKRAEEELQKREAQQALVLSSLPMAFYTASPFGDYGGIWVSPQIEQITGFPAEQFISDKGFWAANLHPEDQKRVLKEFRKLGEKDSIEVEYQWQSNKGNYLWIMDRAVLVRDKKGKPKEIIGTWLDITERKQTEEKIKASLQEKEVILREIHHRVKNNMQIISSLLRIQSKEIEDKTALEKFKMSQNRIKSMALIHESLYRSKDLARIDFLDYIKKLSVHILSTYSQEAALINLKLDLGNVYLDITRAIPCGQILNELLSNAIKHAFPKGKKGEIKIKMNTNNNGKFALTIADNGIGFPKKLDFRKTETLGMQLVNDLVKQLHGTIKLQRKDGTAFKIVF